MMTTTTPADNTITGIASKSGPKYFSSSFDKAELAVTLQGTGPFTVLPPMQHLQLSINSWIRIDK
jgi:hypothetical protein